MRRQGRWLAALAAATALGAGVFLASCGSGLVAGIEGTGAKVATVSAGPISRFGSIFVNGVEFTTSGATVLVNGQASTAGALQAGDQVVVRGTVDPNGTTGTATQVEYDVSVAGPIGAANAAASTLTVLGQTVQVGTQTTLAADTNATPSFAAFLPGTLVEVSGYEKSTGQIAATRVTIVPALAAYRISGRITAVGPAAAQFAINAETIVTGGATLSGFPAGATPQVGDRVRVDAPPLGSAAVLPADAVALLPPLVGAAGDQGQIDGEITDFVSATQFDVDQTHVLTNAQTQYQNGAATQLAADVHVSVQGTFDASGTLTASIVNFQASDPLLLQGPVGAVNPAAGTLSILGVTITTDRLTQFSDESAVPVVPFDLAAISVGDEVEVHARVGAGNVLLAGLLSRERPSTEVQLRGPASFASDPTVVVLGVTAVTSPLTRYLGPSETAITAAQFFTAAAAGATVSLSGTWTGASVQVATAALPGSGELDN
ncbi:MAG: hypothetical protein KGL34_01350 [Gammaproteobacteria bacterium]|nr:hypothetical protein [Gammaproteobacteria bacterium]